MKKRLEYIDISRGIAILGVLYGHALVWSGSTRGLLDPVGGWFWSFNMPLFAIVAGYFYHYDGVKTSINKDVKHLLLPFLVTSVLCVLFTIIHTLPDNAKLMGAICEDIKSIILSRGKPAGYWFVISLFECRFVMYLLEIIRFKYKYIIIFAVCVLLHYCPIKIGFAYLSRSFELLPYFIIGYYMKKKNILSLFDHSRCSILLVIPLLWGSYLGVDIWSYYYPFGAFNIITCTIVCISLLYCTYMLEQKITIDSSYSLRLLSFCGQHSLLILSLQSLFNSGVIAQIHIDNMYLKSILYTFIIAIMALAVYNVRNIFEKRFFNREINVKS